MTDSQEEAKPPTPDELEGYLERHVLAPRLDRLVDREGWGYRTSFAPDWEPLPETYRFLVHQARTLWSLAFLIERRPDSAERLLPLAEHGYLALRDHFRDVQRGGFFHTVDFADQPLPPLVRSAYADGFALFALARVARLEAAGHGFAGAAELADATSRWIDATYRHPSGLGILNAVALDGSRLPYDPTRPSPPQDGFEKPAAWLDLNCHLQLLQAELELSSVADSPARRERLDELAGLLVGSFFSEPGCLHASLDSRRRPVPGLVSHGHAIEAVAYLIAAAELLGGASAARLLPPARQLLEHALAFGWDPFVRVWTERGGALERGRDLGVGWWVAFEAINTLSLAMESFPDAAATWRRALADSWSFIDARLTDREHDGIWLGYDERGALLRVKSGDWFSIYHATRALVNTADRLRSVGTAELASAG